MKQIALVLAGFLLCSGASLAQPKTSASPNPTQPRIRPATQGLNDTDYDGRSDAQELADGTDPRNPNGVAPARLGYWRFNRDDWRGEKGESPLLASDVRRVASYDGGALEVNRTNGTAILKYRDVEADGSANINCRSGSVRFWYKPYWSSKDLAAAPGRGWGQGPGHWVRLIELGSPTNKNPAGWFALSIDPAGTNLLLQTQSENGEAVTHISGRISFTYLQPDIFTNGPAWHEIVATYSPARTTLRTGGSLIAEGSGIAYWPPPGVRAKGFTIGSSMDGSQQAQGLIDEVETFNYPIGPIETYASMLALSATARLSPAQIELRWRSHFSQPITIQRRWAEATNWTLVVTNFLGLSFTDTNVIAGRRYEYNVFNRYLLTGINAAPVEKRGRVILLVDQTLAAALATPLAELQQDLVGEGWSVIRHDVPRHNDANWKANTNNIATVKSLIASDYAAAPMETKTVLIIGHVAIPYSGYEGLDGHPEHQGAWPTDGFYGDVDGVWTDDRGDFDGMSTWGGRTKTEDGVYSEQKNVLGDGKFDNDFFPTNKAGVVGLELAVGRIDFARLPVFYKPPNGAPPKTETDLLRQYLAKDHRYRHKQFSFENRAMVTGRFYEEPYHALNQTIYFNALRNASRWFGLEPGRVVEGDFFTQTRSCLWGFEAGWGAPNRINDLPEDVHTSADLTDPGKEPPVAFYMLDGSFFGDWNMTDNLMRAALATPRYGLGAMWAHATEWRLETLALGEPIGSGLIPTVSQNVQINPRHLALMGDPTLRLQITAPPRNLMQKRDAQGKVILTWDPSPEAEAKYLVYRTANSTGPFVRLTKDPITARLFKDNTPPAGKKSYEVRALELVTSGSGSFTNLSQGVFVMAD